MKKTDKKLKSKSKGSSLPEVKIINKSRQKTVKGGRCACNATLRAQISRFGR